VLAELDANNSRLLQTPEPRTLIQRAYLDLTGLRPTFEQVEAFGQRPLASRLREIVEDLLASPRYGERWGRYWLDVGAIWPRQPDNRGHQPPYPFRVGYRDWGHPGDSMQNVRMTAS